MTIKNENIQFMFYTPFTLSKLEVVQKGLIKSCAKDKVDPIYYPILKLDPKQTNFLFGSLI